MKATGISVILLIRDGCKWLRKFSSEAAIRRCSLKKVFLNIFTDFFCEYCKIFKNTGGNTTFFEGGGGGGGGGGRAIWRSVIATVIKHSGEWHKAAGEICIEYIYIY